MTKKSLDVPVPTPAKLPPTRGKETKEAFTRRHVRAVEQACEEGKIVVLWQKNDGHHLRVQVVATERRYDLWPASGLWQEVGSPYKPQRGGIHAILKNS